MIIISIVMMIKMRVNKILYLMKKNQVYLNKIFIITLIKKKVINKIIKYTKMINYKIMTKKNLKMKMFKVIKI